MKHRYLIESVETPGAAGVVITIELFIDGQWVALNQIGIPFDDVPALAATMIAAMENCYTGDTAAVIH